MMQGVETAPRLAAFKAGALITDARDHWSVVSSDRSVVSRTSSAASTRFQTDAPSRSPRSHGGMDRRIGAIAMPPDEHTSRAVHVHCGQQAALALADRIGERTVRCQERDRDPGGRLHTFILRGPPLPKTDSLGPVNGVNPLRNSCWSGGNACSDGNMGSQLSALSSWYLLG
jgi:hypothetical protein